MRDAWSQSLIGYAGAKPKERHGIKQVMAAARRRYYWQNLFLIFYFDSEIPPVPCSLFWQGSLLNSAVQGREGGQGGDVPNVV